jgi:hypothetical protein
VVDGEQGQLEAARNSGLVEDAGEMVRGGLFEDDAAGTQLKRAYDSGIADARRKNENSCRAPLKRRQRLDATESRHRHIQ